jgi:predicted Zn-dependent peptidase
MATTHKMHITDSKFIILFNRRKNAKTLLIESYINNGTVDEKMENLGISHLLEHVCVDGWKGCKNASCSTFFKPQGSIINASTGQTYINYWIKGLPEFTDSMLDYIVSISTNPGVDANRLKKEKKAVETELRIHETNPQLGLYNLLNHMLFLPEGLQHQDNIQAQIDLLPKLTPQILKDWALDYYGSGNTVISITGNFNERQILNKIKKKLKKEEDPRIRPYYKNIFKPGIDVQHLHKNIDNTTIFFVFWSPLLYNDKNYFLIELFKEFVGTGTTSILFDRLREQKNLIYNIGIDYYTMPYGTYFLLEISTKTPNVPIVVEETIKILKKLSANKFTLDDLKACKRSHKIGFFQDGEPSNEFISTHFAEQYINQLFNVNENTKVVTPEKMFKQIQDVKKHEFAAFINKILVFSNLKIAYQGKKKFPSLLSKITKLI